MFIIQLIFVHAHSQMHTHAYIQACTHIHMHADTHTHTLTVWMQRLVGTKA